MNKIYNNLEIKTEADRVRQKFIDKGFSYLDISESDFYLLLSILSDELRNFNNNSFEIKISKKPQKYAPVVNFGKDGMKSAFIKVSSYYFSGREGISFNEDGFIGFAGWACPVNLKPFCVAFEKWIDILSKKKEGK